VEELQAARVSGDYGETAVAGDAALLYQKKDLSLKEGETIRYMPVRFMLACP
jgi:hypothetical protein